MTKKVVLLVALVMFLSAALPAMGTDGASKDPARKMQSTNLVLHNGVKAQIKDNRMFIIGADGRLSPAKDGIYQLMDGRNIRVTNGIAIIDMNKSLITETGIPGSR